MSNDGCPVCEGARPHSWILTHLNPPATVVSCEDDIIVNLITMLAIELDMPAAVLYEIIETSVNAPVEDAKPEPEAKPAVKRGRKPKLAAEAAPVAEVDADAVEV